MPLSVWLFCVCILAFVPVGAEEGDVSNEDIMNEIKGTRKRAYKPNHFLLNVKPISFILPQMANSPAPLPYKPLQAKARIFRTFGIQAEPVFVAGGHGGYGFTVGPAYFPTEAWEEVHVGPKYEFDYINKMGAYHGFMIQMDRHYLIKFFTLTWGFAVGFGFNGSRASGGDEDSPIRIHEVTQGLTYDVNLGFGFAL